MLNKDVPVCCLEKLGYLALINMIGFRFGSRQSSLLCNILVLEVDQSQINKPTSRDPSDYPSRTFVIFFSFISALGSVQDGSG